MADPADGYDSAVGIDGGGRFVIGFSTPAVNVNGANEAVGVRFLADGTCVDDPVFLSDDATTHGIHGHVSVDMNRAVAAQDSYVGFGWIGARVPSIWLSSKFVLEFVTDFDSFASPQLEPPSGEGPFDHEVSIGIDDSAIEALAWNRGSAVPPYPRGLVYWADGMFYVAQIQDCGEAGCHFPDRWEPCIARRGDGYFAVAWAAAENNDEIDS